MSPVTSQFFTLRDLICLVERTISLRPSGDKRDEFQEAVNRSGLLALEPFNLLSIYGSAQHRHEMKPGLRLKYIHNQLFGFRNLPAGDDLPHVQEHFISELIERYPVLSQLFIREMPRGRCSAWGMTTECRTPDLHFFIAHASSHNLKCLVTLRVGVSAHLSPEDEPGWVFFRGPTSSFRTMASRWLDHDTYPSHRLLGISCDQSIVSRRDGSEFEIATKGAFPTLSPGGYMLSKRSQKDHIACFLNLLGDIETRILAMATGSKILPGCRLGIGVIIVSQHGGTAHNVWQRVGLCFWAFDEGEQVELDPLPTMESNVSKGGWEVTEGHGVG